MNIDPIWDNTTIAEKISEIIESIRIIPNRVTKIPPFQAHFGRPKTELSNLLTKANTKNLSYNNIKSFYLDKRLLQNPSLTPAAIWDRDINSEVNLDIQYKQDDQTRQEPQFEESQMSNTSESDNAPLLLPQKGTIIPSNFKFQIGDKTTIIDQKRRNIARKTIRRRTPEPRGTLKPLWSIIPDGTIVDYNPHTITIDTHNRKNTVIRNNDIAISTETRTLTQEQQQQQEPKLRLTNFVACKTVGEYNRNKRKIEKFCLAEKAQLAKTTRTGQSPKTTAKVTAQQEKLGNTQTKGHNRRTGTIRQSTTTGNVHTYGRRRHPGHSNQHIDKRIPNPDKIIIRTEKADEKITKSKPKGKKNDKKKESDGISSQKNRKHQTDQSEIGSPETKLRISVEPEPN